MNESILHYSEDFIYNREQADIDQIQSMLRFSTVFGKECFFNFEKFYKQGDEASLLQDYKLQKKGVLYFSENFVELEYLKDLISHIKNIRNTFHNEFLQLDEADLFDIKIILQQYSRIEQTLLKFPFKLNLDTLDSPALLKLIDPNQPDEPVFILPFNITSRYEDLNKKRENILSLIITEKKHIEKILNETFKLSIEFEKPKIVLKEESAYNSLKTSFFIDIIEENYLYIKVRPLKSEKLLKLEYDLEILDNQLYQEKKAILTKISKDIFKKREKILNLYSNIGKIDSFLTKIQFGMDIKGIIPKISTDTLIIKKARNLPLQKALAELELIYNPLDISLNKGLGVLTGSNMGGKTCVLKTIAQIAYLVHSGLMVPAEDVTIPLFNGIFISGPDETIISEGLSSFGLEIFTLKKVWNEKDNFFLYLFDEPSKGTNPSEGKAIVKTIAKNLAFSNSFTVISTHYEGIAFGLPCKKFMIKGIQEKNIDYLIEIIKNNDFSIKTIHKYIDHQVVEIKDNQEVPKNAMAILKLFGFDKTFIDECKNNLE